MELSFSNIYNIIMRFWSQINEIISGSLDIVISAFFMQLWIKKCDIVSFVSCTSLSIRQYFLVNVCFCVHHNITLKLIYFIIIFFAVHFPLSSFLLKSYKFLWCLPFIVPESRQLTYSWNSLGPLKLNVHKRISVSV